MMGRVQYSVILVKSTTMTINICIIPYSLQTCLLIELYFVIFTSLCSRLDYLRLILEVQRNEEILPRSQS